MSPSACKMTLQNLHCMYYVRDVFVEEKETLNYRQLPETNAPFQVVNSTVWPGQSLLDWFFLCTFYSVYQLLLLYCVLCMQHLLFQSP